MNQESLFLFILHPSSFILQLAGRQAAERMRDVAHQRKPGFTVFRGARSSSPRDDEEVGW